MNERREVIERDGAKIYYTDFSNLKEDDFLALLDTAMEADSQIPEGSNILQDISGCYLNDTIKKKLSEFVKIVKVRNYDVAIIGITGLKKIIANALNRNTYFAKDKEDGIDWLVKKAKK